MSASRKSKSNSKCSGQNPGIGPRKIGDKSYNHAHKIQNEVKYMREKSNSNADALDRVISELSQALGVPPSDQYKFRNHQDEYSICANYLSDTIH